MGWGAVPADHRRPFRRQLWQADRRAGKSLQRMSHLRQVLPRSVQPSAGRLLLQQRQFGDCPQRLGAEERSEEHTSELQSLMRISYAVFCLKKKINNTYRQKKNQ